MGTDCVPTRKALGPQPRWLCVAGCPLAELSPRHLEGEVRGGGPGVPERVTRPRAIKTRLDWPGLDWPKCSQAFSVSTQCPRSAGWKQVSGASSQSEDGGGHGQEGRGKWASGEGRGAAPGPGSLAGGPPGSSGRGSPVSRDLPSPFTQQLGFCGD